ncbi:Mur ligase family protein, partial [Acinetobacter baumannii]|nr:Mur ligase family protein [Acinetobacter baumannii]
REFHPRVAVLLNITPDHLGWHKTHENYALAKIDLFRNMDESDLAIVNVEDEGISAFADRVFVPGRRVLSLGLSDAGTACAAFVRDGRLVVR